MIIKGEDPPTTKTDDTPAPGETQDDNKSDNEDAPPEGKDSGGGLAEHHALFAVRRTEAPPEATPTGTQNRPGDMGTEEMKENNRKLAEATATDLKRKDEPHPK